MLLYYDVGGNRARIKVAGVFLFKVKFLNYSWLENRYNTSGPGDGANLIPNRKGLLMYRLLSPELFIFL